MIETRHLIYFVAAAEHGSFRKAGVALGIQQSAISRRVRDLEDRLGAALFHRHSAGVRLTFAGKRYLPRARQIIRRLGESTNEIASVGRSEQGHVRIGIYSSIASGFLTELLAAYGRKHDAVRIELIDGNPSEHVAAIRKLTLDVAFLTGERDWPECDRAHLWSERVFVVLPDHHGLATQEEVAWRDLAEEPFIVSETAPGQEIHDHLVRELANLSLHPSIQVQFVGRDNLLPLVAIGQGLTLISEALTVAQFPGVVYRPIAGEILPFSAVWSPLNDNPAFRRFLSMARERAKLTKGRGVTRTASEAQRNAAPSQSLDPSQ